MNIIINENDLKKYLISQKEWVTEFLNGLLAIKSESGDEENAMAYISAELESVGIDVKSCPISEDIKKSSNYSYPVENIEYKNRRNLAIRYDSKMTGKTIALNTHVDVVPPSPGQKNPYVPFVDNNGYIHARGACDAKGQIAVLILLIKAAQSLKNLKHNIVGHIVVEEEFGGNGTLGLLDYEKVFTADALINLEPTDLRLMTMIRGAVWFDMVFMGKSGHAGSSENTQSATDKAIAAVGLLKQYHKELLSKSRDYGLFMGMNNPMPLTIGEFNAGSWPAMVPGEAHIAGVLGFLPNTNKNTVMEEIRELFNRKENLWISEGMTMEFTYKHNAVELPIEHWFSKNMSEACRKSGINGVPTAMTASSDAIFYQELGIPSLAFGPGKISDAHSCHEIISIDDILKATEVIYTFMMKI